jgi:hypothetical protein
MRLPFPRIVCLSLFVLFFSLSMEKDVEVGDRVLVQGKNEGVRFTAVVVGHGTGVGGWRW